ncbi:hypothetical protein FHS14_003187 [Paenibacillus baekrokdamisoli]|nr:hypothetical protein [Paenibacillus baekrokdamisoli]
MVQLRFSERIFRERSYTDSQQIIGSLGYESIGVLVLVNEFVLIIMITFIRAS